MPQTAPHPHSHEPPARLPAEERRRQLIEVAIDLFSRRGFNGTTTKEIAAAAGVTEAIIFRHFATKEQLYTAILDSRYHAESQQWFQAIESSMAADDDEAVFRSLMTAIVRVAREDAPFERVMLYAALEGHELAAMHHQQFAIPIVSLLQDYVARRQAAGVFRAAHPKAILFAAAGMAKQYAMHAHMCAYTNPGLSDEQAIETFTQVLMSGIRAEQNPRSNV